MVEPVKPPIMKLPIWREIRVWIQKQQATSKSRGHFNLKTDTPEKLLARCERIVTDCVHPNCQLKIYPIRRHHNSKTFSLHVTGPRNNGHRFCSYGNPARAAILALQLDIDQAQASPRIQAAKENLANRHPQLWDDWDKDDEHP